MIQFNLCICYSEIPAYGITNHMVMSWLRFGMGPCSLAIYWVVHLWNPGSTPCHQMKWNWDVAKANFQF